MKRYVLLAIIMAAVFFGACAKESSFPKATGEGSIRAINAISTSPEFSMLIEERPIGSVQYKSASAPAPFDDLLYSFNFEVVLTGNLLRTRVASEPLKVEKDKDYTFIISGAIDAPDILLWEGDIREWADGDTVFEARFGHTAESLGDIDVYFADPSIPPVQGSELGTLAFGEFIPAADFPAGDYVLTLTTAGDDTDILFQSDPVTLVERSPLLITVFDGDANDLSPWAVRMFNMVIPGTSAFVDARFPPTLRFFHTSLNFDTADIYVDDPLTTPLVADHTFRDVTDDLGVSAGLLPLTYTTADNIGSILIDTERTVSAGTQAHIYVIRSSLGTDLLLDYFPNRRSIETHARFSIINTVPDPAGIGLDVYFVPAGESIDEALPLLRGVAAGSDPVQIPFVPGSYDIYITEFGEKTVLTGPVPLDLALGDVVDSVIYENVDPTIVDLVYVPVP